MKTKLPQYAYMQSY